MPPAIPGHTPGMSGFGAADLVFAALADGTRRQVLDAIAARGSATATILARDLPVSRQAVVKHIAVLDGAGLVRGERSGREMRYSVQPAPLRATGQWMAQVAADWDTRLAAIKRMAEARVTARPSALPPPPATPGSL